MRNKFLLMILLSWMPMIVVGDNGLNTFKGIWSSVEDFTSSIPTFFKNFGQSFGGSPSGYVYSFDVYNDMRQTVWVGVSEIMSIMGGDLPKSDGWSCNPVLAGANYTVSNQDYYFEMLIKSSDANYSTHMPYLPHPDVLYRQDAISIQSATPASQKVNYYRAFMGKKLNNGSYLHVPSAEYLGYINNNTADAKSDPGNVTLGTTLSSLTIYNSTDTDYAVGFINQTKATTMTKATCKVYGTVQAHSFGLLNTLSTSTASLATGTFADVTTLTPGTIGLFDATSGQLLLTYSLPTNIFQNMPYTLEIYQDQPAQGAVATVQMDLQGLMSGNYDQPLGKVCDITPITAVFWYESAQEFGRSGYMDLPGTLWIVSSTVMPGSQRESEVLNTVGITPGQAVQFSIMRPEFDKKLWLYFVYIATTDSLKAQQFLNSFMTEAMGITVIENYQAQATNQMQLAQQSSVTTVSVATTQSLLVQAVQGLLTLNGGQMIDPVSGLTGYLLGGDVFSSWGVGAGPMFYQLEPTSQNSSNLPMSVVQNQFISSAGSTVAPTGIPTITLMK